MTTGSLLGKILLFTLPLMLSSILQLLFNAVDIVVVGKFAGSRSLAAVSSTSALINLITNLFIGLSVGCNVVVAKHIGEKDHEKIYNSISTSIFISIIGGAILGIVGFFLAKPALQMMGSPADVIDLSTTYLKIYFLGMPALMIYNYGAAILRAQGDTRRPLNFLLVAGVINALLNLFFVVVLKLDVAGVGLATIISQYISGGLIFECIRNEQYPNCFDLKELHIDGSELKSILLVGLPAGLQGTVFAISNVTIQSSINSFGSIVMAGNGAASNLEGFVYQAMNAFYQSAVSFTSQNIGAKKMDRVNKILFTCLLYVTITGFISGFGVYLFGEPLLKIYTDDPAVVVAGMVRLSWVCRLYFLCGIMDVICGCIRGLGNSIIPMIVSLLGACAFRLIWIVTVFKRIGTLDILYVSYPISWTLTAFFHMLFFIIIRRQVARKLTNL